MNLGQSIGLFALVLALYILWQIRDLLLLVFAAVVLANALNVLVGRFQRSGMKRGWAILLSIFLLLTIVVGAFWLIIPPFVEQFRQLVDLVPRGLDRLNQWIEWLQLRLPGGLIPELPTTDELFKEAQPYLNPLLNRSVSFFSNSLAVLLNVLLVLVLTLMFLADPGPYRQAFIRLFPSFYRRRAEEILEKCNIALRGWLTGILFNMSVIASFSWLGLLVLQVPLPLANGILSGLLTFLPNIGPALSVVPPMAIALLDSPVKSLLVLGLYFGIQQLETNVLTPYVMAQQVSLLPAVTLLAQVFFATFFGFLGLLLALPLTVIGQVWLKEVVIKDVLDPWKEGRKSPKTVPTSAVTSPVDTQLQQAEVVVIGPENQSDEDSSPPPSDASPESK